MPNPFPEAPFRDQADRIRAIRECVDRELQLAEELAVSAIAQIENLIAESIAATTAPLIADKELAEQRLLAANEKIDRIRQALQS